MSLFVDRAGRRKSPLALSAFFTGILFFFLFGALYIILAEPLYQAFTFESVLLTNIAHSVIIAVIGSLLGCLMFLVPDKRIAPYGFLCVGMLTLVLYAAAAAMAEGRSVMMQFISMYCLAPTIIGNLCGWSVYGILCRRGYHPEARKTIAEELNEAIQKEKRKKSGSSSVSDTAASASPVEEISKNEENQCEEKVSRTVEDDALFGPDSDVTAPPVEGYSYQDEAMLLFGEEDELESIMDEHLGEN